THQHLRGEGPRGLPTPPGVDRRQLLPPQRPAAPAPDRPRPHLPVPRLPHPRNLMPDRPHPPLHHRPTALGPDHRDQPAPAVPSPPPTQDRENLASLARPTRNHPLDQPLGIPPNPPPRIRQP